MIVEMISAMEMVNCETTSPFLKQDSFVPVENLPFNTVTGLKEDKYQRRINTCQQTNSDTGKKENTNESPVFKNSCADGFSGQ